MPVQRAVNVSELMLGSGEPPPQSKFTVGSIRTSVGALLKFAAPKAALVVVVQ